MNELNALYSKLVGFGLISLREAVRCQDLEWAEAEIEQLHNIPSLLDEPNVERHRYFWFTEREAYIQWVKTSGHEVPQRRMRLFYEPVWREMEPILLDSFSCSAMAREK
jgi:hypothetical protein